MYELFFSPKSIYDISEIGKYISVHLHNPTAANKLVDKIYKSIELLKETPYMYQVHYFKQPTKYQYRKIIVKNYLIFYRVTEEPTKKVVISRIIYAKSNYENIL